MCLKIYVRMKNIAPGKERDEYLMATDPSYRVTRPCTQTRFKNIILFHHWLKSFLDSLQSSLIILWLFLVQAATKAPTLQFFFLYEKSFSLFLLMNDRDLPNSMEKRGLVYNTLLFYFFKKNKNINK